MSAIQKALESLRLYADHDDRTGNATCLETDAAEVELHHMQARCAALEDAVMNRDADREERDRADAKLREAFDKWRRSYGDDRDLLLDYAQARWAANGGKAPRLPDNVSLEKWGASNGVAPEPEKCPDCEGGWRACVCDYPICTCACRCPSCNGTGKVGGGK